MAAELKLQLLVQDDVGSHRDEGAVADLMEYLESGDSWNLERKGTSTPKGAKVGLALDSGTIIVSLAASGGVLTTLINALQSWLTQRRSNTITIEVGGDKLTLTNASPADQRQLLKQWLQRHR